MDTFEQIKNAYNEAREAQRGELIEALNEKGFRNLKGKEISKSGGKGKKDYTNKNTINQFDLSNWKWVSCSKDGFNYFISLQAFDQDIKSKNRHVLFDRIGVYKYKGKYNAYDAFYTMENTNIDLPLNEEKIEKLVKFMETLYEE